jgi:hypothetical protein
MFKIISVLFLLLSLVQATELSQTSQNIRSYPLLAEKIGVKASYSIINSGLDIFSIRSNNNGSATQHGSLGDMNSLDLSLGYGYNDHISFLYDFEYQDLDYAGESLKNRKNELFVKLNIYHNPSAFVDTFSTDFGFIYNSANDLSITGSSLGISKMDDMSDSSFYMRLLAGSKIMSSVLDFYLGLKFSAIDTTIDGVSHDRNEIALNAGFQYTIELGSFLIETGYEYIRLFSRDIDNGENSNHILNLTLSKVLSRDLLMFIGTKYYTKQYNGVIPYLYNEKSKNSFNQKFGYATLGLVYSFDLNFDGLNQQW